MNITAEVVVRGSIHHTIVITGIVTIMGVKGVTVIIADLPAITMIFVVVTMIVIDTMGVVHTNLETGTMGMKIGTGETTATVTREAITLIMEVAMIAISVMLPTIVIVILMQQTREGILLVMRQDLEVIQRNR